MLYKINDTYYVHVGRKYYKVELVVNGNDVSIKTTTDFVEESPKLVVEQQAFDEDFKKSYVENNKMEKPVEKNKMYR